ncbi:MAG: outer membrane lipoprotein-sorting protein [Burkholderiaceae bacterium]|nr:outer membrane lipoprotein-sorting protein [Burkholderiaceae bacterium]
MERRRLLIAPMLMMLARQARSDGSAAQIAVAVADRPAGRDLTTLGTLELRDKGGATRTREFVSYRRDTGVGGKANLIRFLSPADIAGTALLSLSRSDGEQEQSLYLPAMDRVRRVASDRKAGRFVGSDIYYEDLLERRPHQDRHRLLGKEVVDGTVCDMLESVPVEAGTSAYLGRVSWIDTKTLLPRRVDYHERDAAKASKRWELLAHRRVKGYWTVLDSRVTDLETGHSTRLTVHEAIYDRGLPASLFTPRALADETLEAEYRP